MEEISNMIELLQKAFEVEDIKTESYNEGVLFGKKITKFHIPEQKIMKSINDFPMIENAIKAGLVMRDKKNQSYYTWTT